MTHACCPSCRLRFTRAAAAHLVACPLCGEPPRSIATELTLGYRLLTDDDRTDTLPVAVAIALPLETAGPWDVPG
jgi:hypothetical protein